MLLERGIFPAVLMALTASYGAVVQAADFPVPGKPISLVVGFAAGGGVDLLARTISEKLGQELGATVIVENRPGAGGSLGAEYVARATPDGHTLSMASGGAYTVAPSIKKDAFDPARQMRGVSLLARMPLLLLVSTQSDVKDVKSLIAKAHKETLFYGSGGAGSLSHLAGEYFNLEAGIKSAHSPYKGSAPAAVDIAAGLVTWGIVDPSVQPLITAGKLKAIGLTTESPLPQFAGVPTIAKAGDNQYELVNWYGMAAPAAVPDTTIEKINAALAKVMKEPDVVEKLARGGLEAQHSSPQAIDEHIARERSNWERVIKAANITMD